MKHRIVSLSLLAFCMILSASLLLPAVYAAGREIQEYPVSGDNVGLGSIVRGPDNNMWFTDVGSNEIGVITPSGSITKYPVTTPSSGLNEITVGPDSNLWFVERNIDKIGKITTSGVVTEYPVGNLNAYLNSITTGPDGNLWFTQSEEGKISKMTTAGVVTEYPVANTGTFDLGTITTGPDGNLWFTKFGTQEVGKITVDGNVTLYSLPSGSGYPSGITQGPDGNLWVSVAGTGIYQVGKITVDGNFTAVPGLTGETFGYYRNITVGSDGNLWVTELFNNKVAMITTSGTVTEYDIPTPASYPNSIAAGTDGSIWFVESAPGVNKIGVSRLIPDPEPEPEPSPTPTPNPGTGPTSPDTKQPTLAVTGGVLLPSLLFIGLLVALTVYIYIDYRRHKKPLTEEDSTIPYTFGHHIKIVTLPLLRYRLSITVLRRNNHGSIKRF